MNGLQRVLNEGAALLGNPVALIDATYRLLAHTENPAADDPLWNELLELKTFSHETVDFFNRAKFIQAFADSETVALLQSEALPYDRVCGKVFDAEGVQLGSVSVVACRKPFGAGDFEKIAALCERLSEENEKSGEARWTEQFSGEAPLAGLLEGKTPEGPDWFRRSLKPYLFVAAADVSRYERTGSHLAYFRNLFSKLRPDFQYCIHLDEIVILMSADAPLLRVETDLKELSEFFERYNIFAGISEGFRDLSEIRARCKQAIAALNRGASRPCARNIFQYETFGVDGFLKAAGETTDVRRLCNPVALQMRAYDEANGTGYLRLLDAYLRAAKSAPLVCAQTGMTPETLRDALEEMNALFEIDWDDGAALSSLLLSLQVLERT